jgi:4-hydroxy-tetrahydrodipicolinate synthase
MTTSRPSLAGITTAIPTPLDSEGHVVRKAVLELVQRQLDAGAVAIAPLGGTGEYTALSDAQRLSMLEATMEACAGRVPVIAGVLFPGLADAIEAGTAYVRAGANALMLVTPFYYRPTQKGIVDYFKRFSDRVDSDLVLYEIPYRTGVELTPETVSELADVSRVVAMKACNRDLGQQLAVVRAAGERIEILTGEEDVFPLHVAMGAVGGILASSNLLPWHWNEILARARRGELSKALALHAAIKPAIDALFAEPNPAPIKAALHYFHAFPDGVLSPLLPASDGLRRRLVEVLTPFVAEEQRSVTMKSKVRS